MSEAITLSDLLKTSQQVTSLGSSDRLLAIDADGKPSRITRDNAVNQGVFLKYSVEAGDGRWIRIARMTNYGSGCMLNISCLGFNNGWFFPIIFIVSASHGSSISNIFLNALGQKPELGQNCKYPFSKVRVTGSEQMKYIDIFMPDFSAVRTLVVAMTCSLDTQLVTPVENPTASTYTKEVDIASLFGG